MGRRKECKDGGPERDSNEAGRCEDRKPEGDAEAESALVKLLLGLRHSGENIESVAMNILRDVEPSREDNKLCET